MQSFSRCIYFLEASLYADLCTVLKYWWMTDPSACQDWYFRPARNYFNFGNIKKSHGARSREYKGKTITFAFFNKKKHKAAAIQSLFSFYTYSSPCSSWNFTLQRQKTEGSFYLYCQLGYVKRSCDLILPVALRKDARPCHLILQLAVVRVWMGGGVDLVFTIH